MIANMIFILISYNETFGLSKLIKNGKGFQRIFSP